MMVGGGVGNGGLVYIICWACGVGNLPGGVGMLGIEGGGWGMGRVGTRDFCPDCNLSGEKGVREMVDGEMVEGLILH